LLVDERERKCITGQQTLPWQKWFIT